MNTPDTAELNPLGRIVATHGLRGELKVHTHPEDRDALLVASRIYLQAKTGQPREQQLVGARRNKGYLVIRLLGLDHISQVEELVGQQILVRSTDLRREPGQLFWFELAGLRVIDRQRGEIGILEDMFVTAAHGIYVIQGPYGEVLLPALEPFVLGVDRAARILQVDVPDGLFPGHQ